MFFKQISLLLLSILVLISGHTSLAAAIEARANATTATPAPRIGPNPDVAGLTYDAIIVYTGQACSGSYYILPLADLSPFVCTLPPIDFYSAEVYTPTGAGLSVAVYAAVDVCEYVTQLPVVDTCYNLFFDGVAYPFDSYYIT